MNDGNKAQGVNRNQLQTSLSLERAAVYCFSLLCAGYVIPSNSLRAKLCALLNTLGVKTKAPSDSLSVKIRHFEAIFPYELEHP